MGGNGQGHDVRGSQSVGSGSARNTPIRDAANTLRSLSIQTSPHNTANIVLISASRLFLLVESQDAVGGSRSGRGLGLGAGLAIRR